MIHIIYRKIEKVRLFKQFYMGERCQGMCITFLLNSNPYNLSHIPYVSLSLLPKSVLLISYVL